MEQKFTFNMNQTGRRISELRKKQNMTQMELADKLGISFQAVSNWERGNTMPDISKLPELAQIFNVTTDDLLGDASGLLRSAAKGDLEQYMETNPVTMEELTNVAPLLLPDQMDEGFAKLTQDKPLPSLDDIEDILPFIGKDLVNELALKYADSTERENLDNIAPFVSRQVLEQIADRWAEAGEYGAIENLLPFLARDAISRLALKIYEKEGVEEVEDFMPFLPQDTKQTIAQKECERNGLKAITPIIPFLDRETIAQLIREKYL
ncbi:MAG: helix-turn-helix domain-containing protein [Lachnospiraceae bacterium]|nr:helix-turn-helix domain-containing protein [Lachnospiraceae bacterium]